MRTWPLDKEKDEAEAEAGCYEAEAENFVENLTSLP